MQLQSQTFGSGPPLIILHGLFGSLDNWHSIAGRLAAHFQVFTVDQRNHGRSPHSPHMNYQLMAEDLREFMQAQHLATVRLLGHSMGGKTAMQFALAHPEKVVKLVATDIAPRAYLPLHQAIFDALLALDLSAFQTRGQVNKALARAIPNASLRLFLLKSIGSLPDAGLFWKTNIRGIFENSDNLRTGLTATTAFGGPTLFIRGETSEFIQDNDTPYILRLFPAATIRTIPGAGHWVHIDAPEPFLRAVLEFL